MADAAGPGTAGESRTASPEGGSREDAPPPLSPPPSDAPAGDGERAGVGYEDGAAPRDPGDDGASAPVDQRGDGGRAGPGTSGFGVPDRLLEPLVAAARDGFAVMKPGEVPPRLAPLRGGRPRRLRPADREEILRSLSRHRRFTDSVLDLFVELNPGSLEEFEGKSVEEIASQARGDVDAAAHAVCALIATGRTDEAAALGALVADDVAGSAGPSSSDAEREARALRLKVDQLNAALQREQRKAKLRSRQLGVARDVQEQIAAMRAAADSERAAAHDRMHAAQEEAGELRRRIAELEEAADAWRRERSDMRAELADLAAQYRRARRDLKDARAKIPPADVPAVQLPPSKRPPGLDELKEALATRGEAGVLAMKRLFLIVDGYNVGIGLAGGATLEDKRRRLEQALQSYQSRSGNRVMVVYDGREVEWFWVPAVVGRSVVRVFTPEGQIADDYIVAELEAGIEGLAPVVVTSDLELDQRCRALGALVLASEPVARYLKL